MVHTKLTIGSFLISSGKKSKHHPGYILEQHSTYIVPVAVIAA